MSATAAGSAGRDAALAPRDEKPVVLYSGPEEALEAAREAVGAGMTVLRVDPDPAQVASGLQGASAFLDASMKVRVTAEMIDASPHLRYVVVAATGADHIAVDALQKRDIPLVTLRGREVLRNLTPAAEHSWLLVMACARHLRGAVAHVLEAKWNRTDFPGMMLRGRTIGIVGVGRIGGWMARYANAFGMRVIGYDPVTTNWPADVERVSLDELLAQADVVTLHVPLTKDNAGFFGREQFGRMRRGAIFVNTSRGDLTDEAALLEALQSGQVAAAGLDVLTGEPAVTDHPLRRYAEQHTNLVITPHIGGFSLDAVRVVVRYSAELIRDHLARV